MLELRQLGFVRYIFKDRGRFWIGTANRPLSCVVERRTGGDSTHSL